jgi:hypothetical protein
MTKRTKKRKKRKTDMRTDWEGKRRKTWDKEGGSEYGRGEIG